MDLSKLVLEIDSSGVVKASGNLEIFQKQAGDTEKKATKLEKSVKKTNTAFSSFSKVGSISTAAIVGVGVAVAGLSKSMISTYSTYEMIQSNLSIVLGSMEEATKSFEELKLLAAKTPFSVEGLADAAVQLKQTGTSMKEMTTVLRMLGDVAGGSNEKFNRIVANYAQIQSVGQTTAMDLRQFAMMGLPIYDVLNKMGIQGNATAEQIKEAFRIMTSEGGAFFNGMEVGSKTLSGQFSTLKDNVSALSYELVKLVSLDTTTKSFLENTSNLVSSVSDKIAEINTGYDFAKRIQSAAKELESGTDVLLSEKNLEEKTQILNNSIKETEKSIEKVKKAIQSYNEMFGSVPSEFYDELAYQQDVLSYYYNQLDALNDITEQVKKRADAEQSVSEEIENAEKKYNDANIKIKEEWKSTEEGKISALRDEIKSYEEMLLMKKKIKEYDSEGVAYSVDVEAFNDEQKDKIRNIIDMLSKELEELTSNIKNIGRTWEDVFEEVAGISKEKFLGSGTKAANEFISSLKRQMEKSQEFSVVNLLGIDEFNLNKENFDLSSFISQTDYDIVEGYRSQLELLDTAILGLINDTSLASSEQFKWTDNVIKELSKFREEVNITLTEEERKQAIKDINEELDRQIELIGKTDSELRKIELAEQGILDTEAESILNKEKKIDLLHEEYEYQKQLSELVQSGDYEGYINAVHDKAVSQGRYGGALGTGVSSAFAGMFQGTDTGAFISGTMKGGVAGGVIEMFVSGLANAIGGLDGLEFALNPVTTLFEQFSPLFKTFLSPMALISNLFGQLGNALMNFLDFITFGLISDIADDYDKLVGINDERQEEYELLQKLNNQMSDVISAMKEAEEYYLEQRRSLNADYLNQLAGYKVNDMILTPQGKFSTHPDDYIIATKNPSELGGNGGSVVNVKINNTMGGTADVKVQNGIGADGLPELIVNISKKVASDFASGVNGWGSAIASQQSRMVGRRLST